MPYRTLVIAPSDTGLEYSSDEVMAVVNALSARLLQGKRATIQGLLDIMDAGWEVVWFCTHGDEKGVYLSDGVVQTSELTSLIRSAGVQLTVLNTCSSKMVALAIHDELGTDLICTLRAVPDREAFVTGTILARQLAKGFDFYSAYEAAKPGQNSTYTFIGEKGKYMPQPIPKGREESVSAERFQEIVEQLDAIVNGNARLRLVGLADLVDQITKSLQAFDKRLTKMEEGQVKAHEDQKFIRRLLVGLIVVGVFIVAAIFIAIFFQGTGA